MFTLLSMDHCWLPFSQSESESCWIILTSFMKLYACTWNKQWNNIFFFLPQVSVDTWSKRQPSDTSKPAQRQSNSTLRHHAATPSRETLIDGGPAYQTSHLPRPARFTQQVSNDAPGPRKLRLSTIISCEKPWRMYTLAPCSFSFLTFIEIFLLCSFKKKRCMVFCDFIAIIFFSNTDLSTWKLAQRKWVVWWTPPKNHANLLAHTRRGKYSRHVYFLSDIVMLHV